MTLRPHSPVQPVTSSLHHDEPPSAPDVGRAPDDHADHCDDHARAHGHSHGHGHSHTPKNFGIAFAVGIALNTTFVIVETVYGLLANSLALLADAGHNLSDVLGLFLAWGASVLAQRTPSVRFTYGLRSTSILAALINSVLLLTATGAIAWEAISRFGHHGNVQSMTVMIIAALGVIINTATALMFMRGGKGDLNIRGAFLHMAGDALISLGVVMAGAIIMATGWVWLDPATSLAISLLIVLGTWGLLRDSTALALQAVPQGLPAEAVRNYLEALPGVATMHDLHIWGMSTTETALTAHLVMPAGHPGDTFTCLVSDHLQEKFGIGHATIQIETGDSTAPCRLAPDHVV
ncbi:MAG: cation diffusion facilitator family transporter [Burkholderiaceae bacterium]